MIEFFVPGTPAPAGSKRAFTPKGWKRPIITDACKRTKPWQQEIKSVAIENYQGDLLAGALRLTLVFRVARPQGHMRTGKNAGEVRESSPTWPIVKPDVLKLTRAVEDALTGIIWRDDSQIVQEVLSKVYTLGSTGVQIKIENATYEF